jgi:hypothetical protein
MILNRPEYKPNCPFEVVAFDGLPEHEALQMAAPAEKYSDYFQADAVDVGILLWVIVPGISAVPAVSMIFSSRYGGDPGELYRS